MFTKEPRAADKINGRSVVIRDLPPTARRETEKKRIYTRLKTHAGMVAGTSRCLLSMIKINQFFSLFLRAIRANCKKRETIYLSRPCTVVVYYM